MDGPGDADFALRPGELGARATSPRIQLAQVALDAARTTPGVVRADARHGTRVTVSTAGALTGVSVVAQPDGRYEVVLCLVAELVPLLELAERVRRTVRAAAAAAGLGDRLGAVSVEWADVLAPDEELAVAAATLPGEMS